MGFTIETDICTTILATKTLRDIQAAFRSISLATWQHKTSNVSLTFFRIYYLVFISVTCQSGTVSSSEICIYSYIKKTTVKLAIPKKYIICMRSFWRDLGLFCPNFIVIHIMLYGSQVELPEHTYRYLAAGF